MFQNGLSSDILPGPQDIRIVRERGPSSAASHGSPSVSCRGDLRVLVVEDEAMIGMLIEDILLDLGCGCVDLASSIEGALLTVDRSCPDFAFLDINLKGTKSYPVADVLKARGIPFVFVSAYNCHGLETVHANTKIIQKPFLPRDLDSALDRAFPMLRPIVAAA
jgi:CheY-like chemotaxis protein